MPADLAESVQLARDPGFQGRVRLALIKSAIQFGTEADAKPNKTPADLRRLRLAKRILATPDAVLERAVWAAVADPNLTENTDGTALRARMDAIYDVLAFALQPITEAEQNA